MCPNLTEISGKNIDEAGLRALGRLKGSCLTSIQFDCIETKDESLLDKSLDVLCKASLNLKKFSIIDSADGSFTDAAVQSIVKYCPRIEVLSFQYWTAITDLSVTYLSQLSCLRELDLSDCYELTSAGVQGLIKANRKLESLILSDICEDDEGIATALIDDALLRCIGVCRPHLLKLHMRMDEETNSDLTAASFEAMFKGLPALEELRISNYNKPNAILPMLSMYCPRLKRVYIENIECCDQDFVRMCQGCPLIESLHLRYIESLTDVSILALTSCCRSLSLLNLRYNDRITDDSLCKLFATCIHLATVDLTDLPHITDKAVLTLLRHCPQLTTLGLCGTPRLTDYSILAIATHCPLIQSLYLNSIESLSHETIAQISRYCKQLHTLKLYECRKVNNNTILEVLLNCKHLSTLNIRSIGLDITDEVKSQCDLLLAKRRYRTLGLTYSKTMINSKLI